MILLIDKASGISRTLSEMLYFIGVLSVCAEDENGIIFPPEVYRAVIVCDTEDYERLDKISRSFKQARTFVYSDNKNALFPCDIGRLTPEIFASDMLSEISRELTQTKKSRLGEYRLGALDASISLDGVYFGGKKISFTKTEIMILRSLIHLFPSPVSQSELLATAFRVGRTPEVSNVRTHVCVMNKKFRFLTGKRLISSPDSRVYSLVL